MLEINEYHFKYLNNLINSQKCEYVEKNYLLNKAYQFKIDNDVDEFKICGTN